MKYLLFIVLLVAVVMAVGCVSENKNTVATPTAATPTPTIIVTTTVPKTDTFGIQTPKTILVPGNPVPGNPVPGKVTVYFFYGEECPHCHDVMPFIQNLSKKYPDVDFQILETWHNETNNALFDSLNQRLAIQNSGVPEVIVIGNNTPLVGDRDIPAYLEGVILEQLNKGSEQLTSNIQMIGSVYGLASNPSAGITEIRFTIGLAPGASSIDLTKMKIILSTPSTNPIILTQGSSASTSVFTTTLNGDTPVSSLNLYQQVVIDFKTSPINANTIIQIELRPDVGDALPFRKTAPATISETNVLY